MRKSILATAAAVALTAAAPAAATPGDGHGKPAKGDDATPNAAQLCKAQRTAIGAAAFAELHGTNKSKRNALGKCVSALSKTDEAEQPEVVEAETDAAKTCKAERQAIGVEAFATKYGTNANKRNAFGKCVSTTTEAAEEQPTA